MNWKKICPICAAVVIAWLGMLIWMWSGHAVDKILLAALMGMSTGAIATKYLQNIAGKTLVVALAVPLIWFAAQGQSGKAAIFLGLIILPSWYFNSKLNKKGEQSVDRFKDCC